MSAKSKRIRLSLPLSHHIRKNFLLTNVPARAMAHPYLIKTNLYWACTRYQLNQQIAQETRRGWREARKEAKEYGMKYPHFLDIYGEPQTKSQ